MVCIYCGGTTNVINTRLQRKLNRKWRRRRCQTCHQIFTTIENICENNSLMVDKGFINSQLEPFSRDNLFISLYKSCGHRITALNDAGMITNTVISKLILRVENSCITQELIEQYSLIALKRFDPVAATFYKAYYCKNPVQIAKVN
jgi:transcriptional regulator NrdR family protein